MRKWLSSLARKLNERNAAAQPGSDAPAATAALLVRLLLLSALFLAALALFAIGLHDDKLRLVWLLRSFGIGFAALAASFLCGAGLGFIFAIPKAAAQTTLTAPVKPKPDVSGTNPAVPGKEAATASDDSAVPKALGLSLFGSNSNLEKVSDWLTTVLVGISLTQFDTIVQRLDRAGFALSCAMSLGAPQTCSNEGVIGHAIIIFGAALGFMWLYLWTRRYLLAEWTRGIIEALDQERDALGERVTENARAAGNIGGRPRVAEGAAGAASVERAVPPAGVDQAVDVVAKLGARIEREESAAIPAPLRWSNIRTLLETPSSPRADDPWCDRFGGKALRDGYRVDAYVSPAETAPLTHAVRVAVRRPAGSTATTGRMFLHPSFPSVSVLVMFDASGVATLDLLAYGAFTVGVAVLDPSAPKAVLLELDMTQVDAPEDWKNR